MIPNINARVMDDDAFAYFKNLIEGMTVEEADGMHRMYGVDFIMNDGKLVGVSKIDFDYGMDFGSGLDKTVICPAAR